MDSATLIVEQCLEKLGVFEFVQEQFLTNKNHLHKHICKTMCMQQSPSGTLLQQENREGIYTTTNLTYIQD